MWFYYYVEHSAQVRIKVFNVLGEKVKILTNSHTGSGYHRTAWDIRDVAPGIYLYRMQIDNPSGRRDLGIRKVVIMKLRK